ncbi:phospholipase A2 [Spongiactinospora sp. 9N601]|uniref:phospholipase A2 n=1 Tax=Spongiactinospora sp. 9N601 TaxID=3375149 RepID=UPI0037954B51
MHRPLPGIRAVAAGVVTTRAVAAGVVSTAMALVLGLALPAPGAFAASALSVRETADLIMNLGYADFAEQSQAEPFDWTTDGCTATPPRQARRFRQACEQHDFGYRNYGRGGLALWPEEDGRKWIDSRFLTEMRAICRDRHDGADWCRDQARVLYDAVRLFGRFAYFG